VTLHYHSENVLQCLLVLRLGNLIVAIVAEVCRRFSLSCTHPNHP
jgi:hypothetical protein